MAETVRIGIIGAGWPGQQHARGCLAAGGFKLVAVSDLIPERRKKLMAEFSIAREYADAHDLLKDVEIDAVSICLPNDLHAPISAAALKAGKHVIVETPPGLSAAESRRMQAHSQKHGKVLVYALQRRFGSHEQAAKAAIARGLVGGEVARCGEGERDAAEAEALRAVGAQIISAPPGRALAASPPAPVGIPSELSPVAAPWLTSVSKCSIWPGS